MEVLAVALAAALAAAVQSSVAFGFALVFVPLVSLLIGPREAIATSIVLSSVVSSVIYVEHEPRAGIRSVGLLVLAGVAGTPLGLVVLGSADEGLLRILVALMVVTAAAANLWSGGPRPVERAEAPLLVIATGALSGILRGSTSFAGPPVVLYYHWVGGGPALVRSRLIAYMLYFGVPGVALATIAGLVTPRIWLLVLFVLPGVAAGVVIGRIFRPLLSADIFHRTSMGLLVASSVMAVGGSVVSLAPF